MENRFSNYEDAAAVVGPGEEITYNGAFVTDCYVVAPLPKVGEEVSQAFNGDAYPCGKITRITPSFDRIETEDGTVFQRVRKPVLDPEGRKFKRMKWLVGGTFSMIAGSHYKQNPSF